MDSPHMTFSKPPIAPAAKRLARLTARIIALLLITSAALPQYALAQAASRSEARWLMDHALRLANSVQDLSDSDLQYVSIWLTAATTLDPNLADAYLWRHELLAQTDNPVDALANLDNYCRLKPNDIGANLQRVEIIVSRAQTTEKRIEACEQLLNQPGLSPVVTSDLHRQLAEFHYVTGDFQVAVQHARDALADYPYNVSAEAALAEIEGRSQQPAVALQLLARRIAANPLDLDATWRIAQLLEQNNLPTEAAQWYENTLDVAQRLTPGAEPPLSLQVDLARALLAAKQYEPCFNRCAQILKSDPWRYDAALLQLEAARLMESDEQFQQTLKKTIEQYESVESQAIRSKDWVTCSRIAWLAIDLDPKPQRALRFAQLAKKFNPDSIITHRISGWAELISGSPEQAVTILAPLADRDPLAALGLARAHLALSDRPAAFTAITIATRAQLTPIVRNRVAETLKQLGQEFPAIPDNTVLHQALSAVDRRALTFFDDPTQALRFEVTTDANRIEFDDEFVVTARLTNVADYPIFLGPGQMVLPRVAVSGRDSTHRGPFFDHFMNIDLLGRPVLLPGQTVSETKVITVGAGRFLANRQPQREFDLIFNFVLDPVITADGPPISRIAIPPVDIQRPRPPMDATLPGLARLAQAIHEGDTPQRIRAVRSVIALLVERRASMVSRADYRAESLDPKMLESLIIRAFRDPQPLVRANALFGWTRLQLNDSITQAAAPLISDPHWLVRLVAIEVFSKNQGPRFASVLSDRAENDDHPLVTRLAKLYLKQMTPRQRQ